MRNQKTQRFTRARLIKVCNQHRYLLLRCSSGQLAGIDCEIGKIAANRLSDLEKEIDVVGFIPCNLNEYINYKLPFVPQP